MLELALHQDERIGRHVGVKQCAVPIVSFAAVEHQPIAHRGKRLNGPRKKLREQDLRANVPLLSEGALVRLNHLGPGEFIVEKVSLILVSVGHDRRFCNEVSSPEAGSSRPWSVLEVAWPNPVDLDGLGVDRAIRVDLGTPRFALAPSPAFAQHFDETDFDDDARGSPGKRLLANELGVRGTLASRLRVEGDEPVETVEEIRQVHRGAPKQRQFARVSLIGVTASDRMTLRFRKPDYACERTLTNGPDVARPAHYSYPSPFCGSDLLPFPQQTGEQRAAPTPPTHHATSHEEAPQLALSVLAAVVVIVILVVVIVLLPALAQEMSQ